VSRSRAVLLAVCGLGAGFLSGLLGIAGGVLIVPVLVSRRIGLHRAAASGTSIGAVLPISVVGALFYGQQASIDLGTALVILPTALGGVIVGSLLASRLHSDVLRFAFYALLLITAVRMLTALPPGDVRALDLTTAAITGLAVTGAVIGLLSGLLGSGGGTVLVPALVMLFGLSQHIAQGTTLLVILPICIVGVITHRQQGTLRLREAAVVGAAGALSVIAGALLVTRIPAGPLRAGFALYLLLTVALGLSRGRRRDEPAPAQPHRA
jgi:uncharacterized membrane protein YfcA